MCLFQLFKFQVIFLTVAQFGANYRQYLEIFYIAKDALLSSTSLFSSGLSWIPSLVVEVCSALLSLVQTYCLFREICESDYMYKHCFKFCFVLTTLVYLISVFPKTFIGIFTHDYTNKENKSFVDKFLETLDSLFGSLATIGFQIVLYRQLIVKKIKRLLRRLRKKFISLRVGAMDTDQTDTREATDSKQMKTNKNGDAFNTDKHEYKNNSQQKITSTVFVSSDDTNNLVSDVKCITVSNGNILSDQISNEKNNTTQHVLNISTVSASTTELGVNIENRDAIGSEVKLHTFKATGDAGRYDAVKVLVKSKLAKCKQSMLRMCPLIVCISCISNVFKSRRIKPFHGTSTDDLHGSYKIPNKNMWIITIRNHDICDSENDNKPNFLNTGFIDLVTPDSRLKTVKNIGNSRFTKGRLISTWKPGGHAKSHININTSVSGLTDSACKGKLDRSLPLVNIAATNLQIDQMTCSNSFSTVNEQGTAFRNAEPTARNSNFNNISDRKIQQIYIGMPTALRSKKIFCKDDLDSALPLDNVSKTDLHIDKVICDSSPSRIHTCDTNFLNLESITESAIFNELWAENIPQTDIEMTSIPRERHRFNKADHNKDLPLTNSSETNVQIHNVTCARNFSTVHTNYASLLRNDSSENTSLNKLHNKKMPRTNIASLLKSRHMFEKSELRESIKRSLPTLKSPKETKQIMSGNVGYPFGSTPELLTVGRNTLFKRIRGYVANLWKSFTTKLGFTEKDTTNVSETNIEHILSTQNDTYLPKPHTFLPRDKTDLISTSSTLLDRNINNTVIGGENNEAHAQPSTSKNNRTVPRGMPEIDKNVQMQQALSSTSTTANDGIAGVITSYLSSLVSSAKSAAKNKFATKVSAIKQFFKSPFARQRQQNIPVESKSYTATDLNGNRKKAEEDDSDDDEEEMGMCCIIQTLLPKANVRSSERKWPCNLSENQTIKKLLVYYDKSVAKYHSVMSWKDNTKHKLLIFITKQKARTIDKARGYVLRNKSLAIGYIMSRISCFESYKKHHICTACKSISLYKHESSVGSDLGTRTSPKWLRKETTNAYIYSIFYIDLPAIHNSQQRTPNGLRTAVSEHNEWTTNVKRPKLQVSMMPSMNLKMNKGSADNLCSAGNIVDRFKCPRPNLLQNHDNNPLWSTKLMKEKYSANMTDSLQASISNTKEAKQLKQIHSDDIPVATLRPGKRLLLVAEKDKLDTKVNTQSICDTRLLGSFKQKSSDCDLEMQCVSEACTSKGECNEIASEHLKINVEKLPFDRSDTTLMLMGEESDTTLAKSTAPSTERNPQKECHNNFLQTKHLYFGGIHLINQNKLKTNENVKVNETSEPELIPQRSSYGYVDDGMIPSTSSAIDAVDMPGFSQCNHEPLRQLSVGNSITLVKANLLNIFDKRKNSYCVWMSKLLDNNDTKGMGIHSTINKKDHRISTKQNLPIRQWTPKNLITGIKTKVHSVPECRKNLAGSGSPTIFSKNERVTDSNQNTGNENVTTKLMTEDHSENAPEKQFENDNNDKRDIDRGDKEERGEYGPDTISKTKETVCICCGQPFTVTLDTEQANKPSRFSFFCDNFFCRKIRGVLNDKKSCMTVSTYLSSTHLLIYGLEMLAMICFFC